MNPQSLYPSGEAPASPNPSSAAPSSPASESIPVHETQRLASPGDDPVQDSSRIAAFGAWFSSLPSVGQLLVLAVGAIALLGALGAVLKIIVWSIQLMLLGIGMFLAYRFFFHQKKE